MSSLVTEGGPGSVVLNEISGFKPMSRVKASHCVIGEGKLFLFGGFDEDDKRKCVADGDV